VSAVAKAIQSGEVDAQYFDRKVYHALVTRFRHGLYDNPTRGKPEANVSTAEHVKLAREIAASGTVLLKNNGSVLPLDRAKSIAVIGADASADVVVMETGSPNGHVGTLSVPVDAIRARAGNKVRVDYARGNVGVRPLPPVPAEVLSPPSGKGHGLEGTYFGTPYLWPKVATRIDEKIELGADPNVPAAPEGVNGKNASTREDAIRGRCNGPARSRHRHQASTRSRSPAPAPPSCTSTISSSPHSSAAISRARPWARFR
jgi:beta-glucosidase